MLRKILASACGALCSSTITLSQFADDSKAPSA